MATTTGEEDVCPICLEPYRNPCYLPCGNCHMVCLEPCLTDLVRHHQEQEQDHFPCPFDRNRVNIPAGGATAFQRVSADNGRQSAGPRRHPLPPTRRSGPATPARNSRPPPVPVEERVTDIPTPPRTPGGRQPSAVRRQPIHWPQIPPWTGLIDETEIQQQARLWEENMQRQMELAALNLQRIIRITRPEDDWISSPQVQVTINETRTRPFVPTDQTRGEGVGLERQRERINRLTGKEERRRSRLMDKQERIAEKVQRRMERRAEKEEKRRENEQRKRERRDEKEQRKREARMEREQRRRERVR